MAPTYIYAIIPADDKVVFDVGGLDEHDGQVYALPHRGLAAVVGASPLADYRGLRREEAIRYLVAHQRVVEAVMQKFPVLPVKFGTVLPHAASVRRLLMERGELLCATLREFVGLVQMEVVVLWNLQEVFREIGEEEAIRQRKAQAVVLPPQEMMAERSALGRMVQASLERRRAALKERLLPALGEVAVDLAVNPNMDDSMVLNVALLIDDMGQEALDQRLRLLDQECGGRLRLRAVGPLPPYSFATAEVQVPDFGEVDAARRYLGLEEATTLEEIRRAYHRLAAELHPDHHPADPMAQADMAELSQAYRLLRRYAECQADGKRGACHFDRRTVERTLLLSISGQGALGQGEGGYVRPLKPHPDEGEGLHPRG